MVRLYGGLLVWMLGAGVWNGPVPYIAADDSFPTVTNNERDKDAQPMDALAAAASMQVPAGFHVQVFAAEPEVQNPIDMAWDGRGRLWIAENYTYSDRQERFDLSLRDRVIVLEDTDGDGSADDRRVFVDNVQMLTSVEVGHDGVWLMCPPQLIFIPDADHDCVPDAPARVVLDGFTVAEENYHNFANGLRFGPDGWLYGRCGGSCPGRIGPPGTAASERVALEGGVWRYHPSSGGVEVLTHGTTNPWGHDWDAHGNGFYINTVNGHFWQLIPGAHYTRPFTLDPNPHTYELIDTHADHWHFDTSGAWHESRDGVANAYGGGHAHCGAMIYLGDQWPEEFRGDLLTINLHGRRANREHLRERDSGYVATHGEDLLTTEDPFFRGMELSYGPDGSVYVIDWSDTGECHDHTGVHRTSGRVFRVSYAADQDRPPSSEAVDLTAMSTDRLVQMQRHPNAWFRRQARLELDQRVVLDPQLGGRLEALAAPLSDWLDDADAGVSCDALLTLHAIGALTPDRQLELVEHSNPHLRAWAIRLLTEHLPLDDCYGPIESLASSEAWGAVASTDRIVDALVRRAGEESSAPVRLVLASSIQRLPVDRRAELARPLIQYDEDAEDHNLPLLIWYGLIPVADRAPSELAELALRCRLPTTARLMARRLAEQIQQHPDAVAGLVSGLQKTEDRELRRTLLAGMGEGLRGWRKAPRPNGWQVLVDTLSEEADQPALAMVRQLNVVFGDGRAVEAMREIILDEAVEIGLRRSALRTLVQNHSEGLREICLKLLDDPRINVDAARGLALQSDPEIADVLVEKYRRFRAPERPKVVAMLCSRAVWAQALLGAIEAGKVPADALTAYDVRQLQSMGDQSLDEAIARVWGNVREMSAQRAEQIAQWKQRLAPKDLADADLSAGRLLFSKTCQQCHRLYGQGDQVGPELTGSNRNNLDYLLENIVDPSAVVGKDFRMTVLLLDDGRILNGLVVAENERTLEIQTQTDRQTLDREAILETRRTTQSPMPEGLLDNLSAKQVRDLFAYLMHPSQVPMPSQAASSQSFEPSAAGE